MIIISKTTGIQCIWWSSYQKIILIPTTWWLTSHSKNWVDWGPINQKKSINPPYVKVYNSHANMDQIGRARPRWAENDAQMAKMETNRVTQTRLLPRPQLTWKLEKGKTNQIRVTCLVRNIPPSHSTIMASLWWYHYSNAEPSRVLIYRYILISMAFYGNSNFHRTT